MTSELAEAYAQLEAAIANYEKVAHGDGEMVVAWVVSLRTVAYEKGDNISGYGAVIPKGQSDDVSLGLLQIQAQRILSGFTVAPVEWRDDEEDD